MEVESKVEGLTIVFCKDSKFGGANPVRRYCACVRNSVTVPSTRRIFSTRVRHTLRRAEWWCLSTKGSVPSPLFPVGVSSGIGLSRSPTPTDSESCAQSPEWRWEWCGTPQRLWCLLGRLVSGPYGRGSFPVRGTRTLGTLRRREGREEGDGTTRGRDVPVI